jgi:hypothetical protein
MTSSHRKSNFKRKLQPGNAIEDPDAMPADICQLTPMYADTRLARIPEPQRWRVKTRFVAGQTIRSISRSEHLNRRTVTKIVKSQDVQNHVAALRERFYGLGCAALDAVEHALTVQKDARLGFEILKSIGVVPCGQQDMLPANQEPMSDQDTRVRQIMVKMASIAVERNRVFKTPLPSMDAVEKEIDDEFERQKQEKE